ncbi:unnamed protein product [Linum trigynum]|uniref:Uncharacterized protein n=1 Tax=Linum trigynum TaxID=586398 RepID=A0AAV2E2R2_9ROSI
MAPFDFKSNKHFVASSDGEVASISTNLDGDDGGGDNTADETRTYNGLVFFDGHGKIQGWEALTKLAQHLKRLTLMVNPGGHCFQDVNELGEYVDFGVHYLRLNDLFSWPHHGVDLARTDMWGSSELKYHDPRHGQRSSHMEGGSGISMEKYKVLKRLLTEKDEKLVNLKEEMDDELQNLREKKEDELQELKEEIGKLNEAKEEELKKVRKEKDDELRKLKNEMEEEMEKLRKEKEDELEKLEKDKEEEMLTRLMEKDDELQKLKEKEEELRKMVKRKDEELQKLKDGEETFICFTSKVIPHDIKIFHLPTLTEPRLSNLYSHYHSVDEGIAEEWLAPPEKGVHTDTSGQGQFDVNNWWFAKTSHPEGGTTMMAYYYGDRYCIHNRRWGTIRIPYPSSVDIAANRNFCLANFCGKIVFCFTYRN